MLTQTSELGVNVMLFLALRGMEGPLSPRVISEEIGGSKTYIAKVCGLLAKDGVVRSVKGSQGGIMLAFKPEEITLMHIVEACQGKVLADYCQGGLDAKKVCAFHAAMKELHDAILDVLNKWTLRDLMSRVQPIKGTEVAGHCKITNSWKNLESYLGNQAPVAKPAKPAKGK